MSRGRGRPPVSEEKALKETVSLRLRENELEALRKEAKKKGKTFSNLVRDRLFPSEKIEE